MSTIIKQVLLIIALTLLLGAANNSLNPNKIKWVGEFKDVDASAFVADSTSQASASGLPVFETGEVKIYERTLEQAILLFKNKEALFVDARYPDDYNKGHIPGAINLPSDMFDEYYPMVSDQIGIDQPVLIYCSGPGCDLGANLAATLKDMSYTRIMHFGGGFPAWQDGGHPVEGGN